MGTNTYRGVEWNYLCNHCGTSLNVGFFGCSACGYDNSDVIIPHLAERILKQEELDKRTVRRVLTTIGVIVIIIIVCIVRS